MSVKKSQFISIIDAKLGSRRVIRSFDLYAIHPFYPDQTRFRQFILKGLILNFK